MSEERLNQLRKEFQNGECILLHHLKKYKQVNSTLELLKYDIDRFDTNLDYHYFLGMFEYLSKAISLNIQEQKRIYEEFQEIRVKIKQIMLTSKKDDNKKILKKTLGKLEIISLVLCSNFDNSYEKSKRELLYQLIFEIKNLKVLKDLFVELPHQVNLLEPHGIQLLHDIFQRYILVLQNYLKDENQSNLDDLMYFDRLILFLLERNQNYMSTNVAKNMDKILEEAEEYWIDNKERKEKYFYFIRKWRVIFWKFRKNPKEKLELPEFNEKELCYQFEVHKDFSEGLLESANFICMKYGEKKKTKDMPMIYTIDSEGVPDKDDGFSCEKEGSIYRLGIHITNPMFYLTELDPLMEEGLKRGSTIYYHHEAFAYMFPPVLAENFFSLNEGKVRNVLSAYFTIDLSLKKIIQRELKLEPVYVKKNDTYENVSNLFLYGSKDSAYLKTLENIQELLPFLKQFYYIDDTYAYMNSTTHPIVYTKGESMIETLMIFMNHQVATMALEENIPLLYRNHVISSIYEENLKELKKLLELEKNNQVYLNEINVALGQYPKSKYEVDNKGHYGLGLNCYTHITSPDRRIADDYNLLLLKKCYFEEIKEEEKKILKEKLNFIAHSINERNYALRMFQKEYSLLKKK